MSACAAWHWVVPVCSERWCAEAGGTARARCCSPVVPACPVWAYCARERRRRCREDSAGGLGWRPSPHRVALRHPTGSEAAPPCAPRGGRFGSEPPSVEDDVDVWHFAILELHDRNDDDDTTEIGMSRRILWKTACVSCLFNLTWCISYCSACCWPLQLASWLEIRC